MRFLIVMSLVYSGLLAAVAILLELLLQYQVDLAYFIIAAFVTWGVIWYCAEKSLRNKTFRMKVVIYAFMFVLPLLLGELVSEFSSYDIVNIRFFNFAVLSSFLMPLAMTFRAARSKNPNIKTYRTLFYILFAIGLMFLHASIFVIVNQELYA